jgi:lipoyl(octanoyl) transferase
VCALQEELRARVLAGDEAAETLLFVEHDAVITAGRSADLGHILRPAVPVVRSTRGGDVTVHGPGQLVIYPVVRLRRGVLAHVQGVAGALAEGLATLGVSAHFRRDPVGVFAARDGVARKLAACGLHVRRGVAVHGFALNVADECLPLFDLIVPCGLATVPVTSVERELGRPPPELSALATLFAPRIAAALGRSAEPARERFLR